MNHPPPRLARCGPERPRLSLVVLPLTNQSGDTEQDYLAEQLAEDLSADLARVPGTFVIAHGTAQAYKGRPVEPRAIGRELGVRYVVQGSLRHSAEQVRFAVQLTDVETGADGREGPPPEAPRRRSRNSIYRS